MTAELIEKLEAKLDEMANQMCAIRCDLFKDDTASEYRKGWFAGAQAAYEEIAALLKAEAK